MIILDNIIEQDATIKLKYCRGCDEDVSRTLFHKNGKTLHPICKICRQIERKSLNIPRKEGIKYCPGCDLTHPTTEFHSDKQAPDGLQSYCKKYKNILRLKYLSNYDNFIKKNFSDLRHNAKRRNIQVDITIQDVHNLYKQQNGLCAILNIKMTYEATERGANTQHIINKLNVSVDRIDSSKYYTKDNIQLVCAIINRIKAGLSNNNFLLISGAIAQYNFNKINNLIISNIDPKYCKDIQLNQNYSIITNLFDDIQNKQKINIITAMQKYACQFDGYINKLYLDIKHNLKKRAKNLELSITSDDIKELYYQQEGKCKLSGIKMTHIGYQGNDAHKLNKWNISVDRIDSSKGYTKDNIQLLCGIVNKMKTDMNDVELLLLCNDIITTKSNEINKLISDNLVCLWKK